jgi:glycosyltransferase involved in cell wall biosynthesis
MKVLQICCGYDIGFNGGITNYVRSLSESMANSGHDISVLDSQPDKRKGEQYSFKRITLDKTMLYPFHLGNSLINKDLGVVEDIVKNFFPDIIHIHMMIDLPLAVINIAKKYAKVIISLHDYSYICNRITMINSHGSLCSDSKGGSQCNTCISKLEQNRYTNLIFKTFSDKTKKIVSTGLPSVNNVKKHMFLKEAMADVDMLVAVSSRVKDIYEDNGINNSNFIVNHIGNITADNFTAKENVSQDKIMLAFIGYFSEYKGAELVLKLAEYLNPDMFEIKIFGRLDQQYENVVEKSAILSYEGVYKQNELSCILNGIDLGLVLPVWEDNAPQVVFEFINNGIPVVGTLMGGVPDFIEDNKNGFLIEPNIDSILSLAKKMNSENFKASLEKLFMNIIPTKSVQQHNAEMIEIYSGLLK